MHEIKLTIEPIAAPIAAPKQGSHRKAQSWRVTVEHTGGRRHDYVDPVTDADLAGIQGLPDTVKTWPGFIRHLSPGTGWAPTLPILRAVGKLLHDRLLTGGEIGTHLADIEVRASKDRLPLRFLIHVDDDENDESLAQLPLELARADDHFVFKRPSRPAIRWDDYPPRRTLELGSGSRALIATATSAGEPHPTVDELRDHADAIAGWMRGIGWAPEIISEVDEKSLKGSLTKGEGFDVLYVVCHGVSDRDNAGRLSLRGGTLTGYDLGGWLRDDAIDLKRKLLAAVFCSCSSAAPGARPETSGLAQWLVHVGQAAAAIGFRGPVGVDWALRFMERLFSEVGKRESLENAFCEARRQTHDGDPQWALPLYFGVALDPYAPARCRIPPAGPPPTRAAAPALPPLRSPLPRLPKPYFTAREKEIEQLKAWLRRPGRAVITAVEGAGGIGKSELAGFIAAEAREDGTPVIWLGLSDRNTRAALMALIQARDPGFQAPPELSETALAEQMRRLLGPYEGLLVLDDVQESSEVEPLTPGAGWNVLVTTRKERLLPGVEPLVLKPLEPEEGLLLLCRVAWDREGPEAAESVGARGIVERLGGLPLALELAGGTLRRTRIAALDYLASLEVGKGEAAGDVERVRATIARSLGDLDSDAIRTFLALGVFPRTGAALFQLAAVLDEPEPLVERRVSLLRRHSLVVYLTETGRYWLHRHVWEAARDRARSDAALWPTLQRGVARAMLRTAIWVDVPMGSSSEAAQDRWHTVRDQFQAVEVFTWVDGGLDGQDLALAIATVNQYRQFEDGIETRLRWIEDGLRLAGHGRPEVLAQLLRARGDLRMRKDDLPGAESDYAAALTLFETVESRLGQANVLRAQGDLRMRKGDLPGAESDYAAALTLFETVESRGGQVNVLKARGDLRMRKGDLPGAESDYAAALKLFETVKSRLGQAEVHKARGDLRMRKADLPGAESDYALALKLFEAVEDRLGQTNVLKARGDLEQSRKEYAAAAERYLIAKCLYGAVDDRLGLSNVLAELAKVYLATGRLPEAIESAESALDLGRASQNRYAVSVAETVLGLIKSLPAPEASAEASTAAPSEGGLVEGSPPSAEAAEDDREEPLHLKG